MLHLYARNLHLKPWLQHQTLRLLLCTSHAGQSLGTGAVRQTLAQSVSLCSSYQLEGLDDFYYNSNQTLSECDPELHTDGLVVSSAQPPSFEDLEEFFYSDLSSAVPGIEVSELLQLVPHCGDQLTPSASLPSAAGASSAEFMDIASPAMMVTALAPLSEQELDIPQITANSSSVSYMQNINPVLSSPPSEGDGSLIRTSLPGIGSCGPHSLQELRDREDWPGIEVSAWNESSHP